MDTVSKFKVSIKGTGNPALVFVHGYGCDQSMWRFVAPEFAESHKTVLYDLAGMGEADTSSYDFARYSRLEAHAEDLGAILSELDLSDAVVVGHSVGATIACLAALRFADRIKALAMIAPSPCFINDAGYNGGFDRKDIDQLLELMEQNFFEWAQFVTPIVSGQDKDGSATGELTRAFCRNDPKIGKHFARVTFLSDHREDMAQVSQDALILQCTNDALAPTNVGEWLAEHMPGGDLREIEATGHCPHMTVPSMTITELRRFLERNG